LGRPASVTIAVARHMQTALVIDDDSSLRDTVGLMLENDGFHAVLASDGRIGLEQALAMKPELILVDLRMPGISGIEVCEQLRNRGMKTPLIVLSAVSDEIDKVRLLEIGADDYVVKPFSARELLARIHAVLRRTSPEETKVMEFARRVQFAHLFPPKPRPRLDARGDSEFGMGLRFVPAYAHRGRSRGTAAPEAGTGIRNSAALSDRARRGLSLPAVGNPCNDPQRASRRRC